MSEDLLQRKRQALVARLMKQRGLSGAPIAPAVDTPALTPRPEQWLEPFPLTEVQQAYWLGRNANFALGGVSAHGYQETTCPGLLDLDAYRLAWRKVIERHPMLRTIVRPDGYQQTLAEVGALDIPCRDLRGLDAGAVQQALDTWREELGNECRPADRWPMFDVRVSLLDGPYSVIHFSGDALMWDVYSDRVIFRELAHFYRHPDEPLPPLEVGFRDYVLALEQQREGPDWERAEAYWHPRLATLPGAPDLPLAVPLEQLGKPCFRRHRFHLDSTAWQSFRDQARGHGLTSSVALLSAFVELLRVWNTKSDFLINTTLFNRPDWHPQLAQVVGDFTATLLVACEEPREEGFAARSLRLQSHFFEALEHRRYSGVRLLRELAQQRRQPQLLMPVVFTSALSLGEAATDLEVDRFWGEETYAITQTPQVLIDHQVYTEEGRLVVNWDVVDDAFPKDFVNALFSAYQHLLLGLVAADWQQPLVPDLPDSQRALLAEVNDTAVEYSAGSVQGGVFDQIRRQPEAVAVIDEERQLSYRELGRWAGAVAECVPKQPAAPVAVFLPKGWRQVAAVLGVLAAGAAYVPLEPEWPARRIARVLERIDASAVVTTGQVASTLDFGGRPVIDLDALTPAAAPPTTVVPRADDLAYVIFTSGSTGEPKGVMMQHGAVRNTLEDINHRFGVGPGDRVLALSSLAFDLSVYDIFGVLSAGGSLVMPAPGRQRDPEYWMGLCRKYRVTLWNSVPALLQMLVEYAGPRLAELDALRLALLSGDWIPRTLPGSVHQQLPSLRLVSLGGATEAAIWSIQHPAEHLDPAVPSIPYGKPLANQRFYVLDDKMRPRPLWVAGELYIGGVGLAQGYWDDEAQTQERFVTHPHTGERLYRTGDLGRYLADGSIEFLGRRDQQVKINGFRVELGEIETVLQQHPAVAHGVVDYRRPPDGGVARLVAYVIPADGSRTQPDTAELERHLAEHLPRYMLPGLFVTLDALPLSANGKLDRSRLPEPHVTAGPDDPAANALEEALAQDVAEILGLPRPASRKVNFFDLGANSLSIVALHQRLERRHPGRLALVQLFESPNVASLAALLKDGERESDPVLDKARRRAARRQAGISAITGESPL